ncbi:MAG: P-II family nitrogen regulator [Thermodesulfobacteriota bacterium]
MKEIKAYIRCVKAEDVVHALKDAGVAGLTIISVTGFGGAAVQEEQRWSIEYAEKCTTVAKLELVCSDDEAESFVRIIKEKAYTGHSGDGMIFVTEVVRSIKIRTGGEGDGALRP